MLRCAAPNGACSSRVLSVLTVLVLSNACTKFASEDDTPGDTSSQLLVEGAPGTDWSCVTDAPAPPVTIDDTRSLTYGLSVVNFVGDMPLPGVQVRTCYRADVACASPAVGPLLTDDNGSVSISLFEGFNGYLELTSERFLPTLVFFPDAWSLELLGQLEQVPIALLAPEALVAFGASARVPLDVTAGIVTMNTFDCGGPFAPGVRLELDSEGIAYAFVDDLPVPNQNVTSAQGNAGFVNVPPGIVVVTALAGDEQVGLESMFVRSGWVSSGTIIPSFAR